MEIYNRARQFSNKKGFTIVELLVSISIIIILLLVAVVNYRTGRQRLALERSAYKLAQDIRRVQEMAMAAEECTPPPESCPEEGGVPNGGYGIYFEQITPESYIIYADSGSLPEQYRYNGQVGEEETMETIDLEKEVEIQSVTPLKASVNFIPPDPIVDLKDDAGFPHENITIIIRLKADPSKTKTIKVNEAGLIEIE